MSNRKIFCISDTHLSHANLLSFLDKDGKKFRGDLFKDIDEMDNFIIDQWNSVVRPEDYVYHLGDVYFGSQERADKNLSRLMGHKRLLLGNHDKGKDTVLHKHFEKIMLWRVFPDLHLILSHIPLNPSCFNQKFHRNVHGHIHQNDSPDERYINVSCEKINYKPVLLTDI